MRVDTIFSNLTLMFMDIIDLRSQCVSTINMGESSIYLIVDGTRPNRPRIFCGSPQGEIIGMAFGMKKVYAYDAKSMLESIDILEVHPRLGQMIELFNGDITKLFSVDIKTML